MTKNNMQPTSSAPEVSYILAYCSQTSFCLSKAKKSVIKRMNIYNNPRLSRVCFLYTVIGPENSRQPPNVSDANKSQSRLGHSCFPALPAACLFSFEFSLARIEIISFGLTGRGDYFGFGFATLNGHAHYESG